jgi:glycosyltransferase involved in cell wall biosynthesis
MHRPRISLVTPSFNQARFIERTIASVLAQEGEFDLDYLVLDGGSSDGTLDILRRFGERLSWRSGPDAGQVDAINKGLRAARGDIVGWLNSDDLLAPGALDRVARVFAVRPDVEWVHGRCDIIDVDDRPIRHWVSRYKHWRARRHTLEQLMTENYISQMTVFWRRNLHEKIGYLDPSLPLAFDYEFWLRLARRSTPFYIEDRLASFRWYDASKSGFNYSRQLAEAAEIAARHPAPAYRFHRLQRYAKTRVISLAYRAMSAVENARRRGMK